VNKEKKRKGLIRISRWKSGRNILRGCWGSREKDSTEGE